MKRELKAFALVATAVVMMANGRLPQPDGTSDIPGIIDQGLNHSEVEQTLEWLSDHIGARLTGSLALRKARE